MRRSTIRAATICGLIYLVLIWAAPASVTVSIEVPGWLWLLGRVGGLFAVAVLLRGYMPTIQETIGGMLGLIVEDE